MHRDFLSIATPEGLTLDLELAGPGSRSAAALIDHVIIAALIFGTFTLLADSSGIGVAVAGLIAFGLLFGFFVIFEMFWRGQSPGKWLLHLKVVHDDGGAVAWRASMVRNLIRVVDFLPGVYLIGLLMLFGTARDQRLGDLAGGTLVIRQIRAKKSPNLTFDMPRPVDWDVTAITEEELAAVRHYLLRRDDLPALVRRDIGEQLYRRISSRVIRPTSPQSVELFLESVSGARINQG